MEALVAIAPENDDRRESMTLSIEAGGGKVVPVGQANAVVWLASGGPDPLIEILDNNPQIKWVQLPYAGVERFNDSGIFDRDITFTCAKELFGGQVGEHALTLILASLRHLTEQARHREWHPTEPESLENKRVTILGAGGIATTLIRYLNAGNCDITVLRRSAGPVEGATRTLPIDQLHNVLPNTDILVLALALTPQTRNIIGTAEFRLLPNNAVLVNVARGGHVDTDALVDALKNGQISAAGLDVTNPEPLPANHPLWTMENVLITSHCADSMAYVTRKLGERVTRNVANFAAQNDLEGVVHSGHGY